MIEAVMWVILMTTDGKTEMEYRVYYSTMQQCVQDRDKANFRVIAEGWKIKSVTCMRFLKPLLSGESH